MCFLLPVFLIIERCFQINSVCGYTMITKRSVAAVTYCCGTNNFRTSWLKTALIYYFLCGLVGWLSGMAGRPKMALFLGLAIGAGSRLRAQLKLQVGGLVFPPCEPPLKPSWAFTQYGGWVPRSVLYKEAEAEDLSGSTVAPATFYWSEQVMGPV